MPGVMRQLLNASQVTIREKQANTWQLVQIPPRKRLLNNKLKVDADSVKKMKKPDHVTS
jgi:hypothetical protein